MKDVDGKENDTSLDTAKVKEVDGKEKTEYATNHGSVFNLIDDSRDVTVLEEEETAWKWVDKCNCLRNSNGSSYRRL